MFSDLGQYTYLSSIGIKLILILEYRIKMSLLPPMEFNFDDSKDLNILDNVPKNVSHNFE